MKINKIGSLLAATLLIFCFMLPSKVHADSNPLTPTLYMSWDDSNCTGTMSGVSGSSNPNSYQYGVAEGDNVTITLENTSSVQINVSVSNDSSADTTVGSYGSATDPATIQLNSIQDVTTISAVSSTTSCSSSQEYPALLSVLPGTATMSCIINSDNKWYISGSSSNTVNNSSLYGGSQLISSSPIDSSGNVDVTSSTETSSVTFYLYNGPNSSSRLLDTTNCSAEPASTTSSTNTGTSATTTKTTPKTTTKPSTKPNDSGSTVLTHSSVVTSTPVKHNYVALIVLLIILALMVLSTIVGLWRVLVKTGRYGWIALIPIYNLWEIYKMGGKPGWWAILQLIPIVNLAAIIMLVIAEIEIAKRFRKSPYWAFLALFLFGFVGWPILGFNKAKYSFVK